MRQNCPSESHRLTLLKTSSSKFSQALILSATGRPPSAGQILNPSYSCSTLLLPSDGILSPFRHPHESRNDTLNFGVEHFLHPLGRPGVPLEKLMPEWIPGRLAIGYLTGAILVAAGACILVAKKTRLAAACLGTWILLLVVFVYGPILIAALLDPSIGAKVEGINYFADTLFFGGAILALASASPRAD